VKKTLRRKVPNQTFPPSLQIAQKARDSHFPTAATAAALRLHFQCLDGGPQGYILNGLTRESRPGRMTLSILLLRPTKSSNEETIPSSICLGPLTQ
jgi:hypothetical protein